MLREEPQARPEGWFLLQQMGTNNRCARWPAGEGHTPAHALLQ